jgi:RNA-binding protein YhbY
VSAAVAMRKVGDRIPHRIAEVVEAVEVEREGRRFVLYRLSDSFRAQRPRIADRPSPRFVGLTSGRAV